MSLPRAVPLLVLLLLASGLLPAGTASHQAIQPGAQMSSSVGSCTLNFVYDGTGSLTGRTFIGTAAHCVRRVGEAVRVGGHNGGATVFYLGDVPGAINGDGRADNGIAGHQLDFALLEITNTNSLVSAEVKGHPGMPSGVTARTETAVGDRVLLSGYGLGFSTTAQTREMRSGVLWADSDRTFNAYAPAISGDSGGPVLHASGQALGVASTIGSNGLAGPTVQGVLAELASIGIHVQLRTA